MSMTPDNEAPLEKEGPFCLTEGQSEAILPVRGEIRVYHDDTPRPRRSKIRLKTKIGLAVLDNRRVFLDSL